MSWLFSRALVAACSEPTTSDSRPSAPSSWNCTADAYWLSDKTTDACPRSQFGMTFGHLTHGPGVESLILSAEAFLARRSARPPEAGTTPRIFGRRCSESWQMPLPGTSLRRTSAPRQSRRQPQTCKASATKPPCFPFPRRTWVLTTFGNGIGYLHTPTTKANYAASSMQKWPSARAFVQVFGRPTPEAHEWLMGWPPGWSDTRPLETDRFRQWQQQLSGHLQTLNPRPYAEIEEMPGLNELVTAAIQLAGDSAVSHAARLWQSEGGRGCPLGWGGCSQPVFVDLKTGEYDYGEPGGPGYADCLRNCRHGMQPRPQDEDINDLTPGCEPPEGAAGSGSGCCSSTELKEIELQIVPITLRTARDFVAAHHRHNKPPVGWKFGIGLMMGQTLVGVATAGRPVARHLDDGLTLEVNRTCTDGTPNANSMLYGAVWRAARAMGYRRCITYTQADETGASLRAAGWVRVKNLPARGSWAESSVNLRARRDPVGNGGVPRVLWHIARPQKINDLTCGD
jgi:hypothetical protein